MAGPNDIPIKNNNMVIPKDVPLWFIGADTNDILKAPISAKANPIAIIQSSKEREGQSTQYMSKENVKFIA